MNMPFSGGCACGAICNQCSAEPIEMFQSHTRDGRRASGGEGFTVVVVPAKFFRLTRGSLRHHFTQKNPPQ